MLQLLQMPKRHLVCCAAVGSYAAQRGRLLGCQCLGSSSMPAPPLLASAASEHMVGSVLRPSVASGSSGRAALPDLAAAPMLRSTGAVIPASCAAGCGSLSTACCCWRWMSGGDLSPATGLEPAGAVGGGVGGISGGSAATATASTPSPLCPLSSCLCRQWPPQPPAQCDVPGQRLLTGPYSAWLPVPQTGPAAGLPSVCDVWHTLRAAQPHNPMAGGLA